MCKCKMCKVCCKKALSIFIILIALALAVSMSFWHEQSIMYVSIVGRFFDGMLPVLAVGALLKYLLSCPRSGDACSCEKPEGEEKK